MRMLLVLLQSVLFTLPISRTTSASTPSSRRLNQREFRLVLPEGWRFEFTSQPQTFDSLTTAAEHLGNLYEVAKESAIAALHVLNPPQAAVMYRLGAFVLIFRDASADDWSSEREARIPWHVVLEFCDSMQYNVAMGGVWKFEGLLSPTYPGDQGNIVVQLRLMSEFSKT